MQLALNYYQFRLVDKFMKQKDLKLSFIIPVYNEEKRIAACLEALLAQDETPYEIIVIDNNCTDRTIEIARKYKGVRIVREKNQGLIASRNRGFNIARGNIFCRIDADSVLVRSWTKRAREAFEEEPGLSGITGVALTHLVPRMPYFRTRFYAWGYFWAAGGYYKAQMLWGANMAIRASAWDEVKKDVCLDDRMVHEDQDLTLCILAAGGIVKRVRGLEIITDGQIYHYYPKLKEYIVRAKTTRALHLRKGTWPVPTDGQLPSWQIPIRLISSFVPGFIFVAVSFVFWPIDRMLLKHTENKGWLGI